VRVPQARVHGGAQQSAETEATVMKKSQLGRVSLFRGKVRGRTMSVTLTPRHWALLDAAAERLVLTRADVIGLLLHKYAATVSLPNSARVEEGDGRTGRLLAIAVVGHAA
jgi:hypothetical protein